MPTIRITKEFSFEAAHALKGYDGPCRSIHGHSYKLWVTVTGSPVAEPSSPKKGMIMDFGDLKRIVKSNIIEPFDHSLVLPSDMNIQALAEAGECFSKIRVVDYQPTSENLLCDFAQRIIPLLPPGIRLYSLRLRETATSFAEWFAD